jgi:predicted TIM-barrel fold metal-dependent hydrolase
MVSQLDIPIFVHIAGTRHGYEAFEVEADFNLEVTLGTMVLDLNATLRIILGGVLTRFPGLKFVIAHMGGGISAIKERCVRYVDAWGRDFWLDLGGTPPFDEPFGENFTEHFNQLYFDMAGYEGGMNAVRCALTTINPERLLFATDYPFNFTHEPQEVRNYIENIRKLDLPSKSIELILGGTAAKLLRL